MSPKSYLSLDRVAERKSEYLDGQMVAMSGGSRDHSRIKLDLAWLVRGQLDDTACEPFGSDLRVRVDADRYAYPDLSVVCGESRFEDEHSDILINPTLIVEVLSPSTEALDRGEKWGRYRRMPSLRQYVLISQDRPLVEVFTRAGDVWTFHDTRGLDAEIRMEAIGVVLRLADLYARVSTRVAALA
jgi:Uma2 family endonuclease